ncbi:MAG: hypothetical protein ACXWT1_06285 [Methylobacter sp.]
MSTNSTQAVALDYESLRQEGISWLEKLAGSEWTDFNAHDPGITILEQVCYALTDFVYRINYDMEDLLSRSGEDTYHSLYPPRQILVTKPVTLLDLRKSVIDVAGVKNAWFEAVAEFRPPLFYHEKSVVEAGEKVIDLTGGDGAIPFTLQGLYRVLIEKSALLDRDSDAIVREVSGLLHAQRSLGIDFQSIEVLSRQLINLHTSIEIDALADPEEVYLAILEKIADYLSPNVRFYTLEERLAQGKLIDEIFEGPLLERGFIDDQELMRMKRKKILYASELIREIMNVSGVQMVEYVAFNIGGKLDDTAIVLDEDKTPGLDIENCKLTLKKRQLPIQLDAGALAKRYTEKQKNSLQRSAVNAGLPLPQGRDRHIDRYYSLLQQFPKVYGIGEAGLPSTAGEERKAQAKQLKAYLLFFDQVLANRFAQLAHLRDLFSFDPKHHFAGDYPISYFAGSLDDPGISDLWQKQNSDVRRQALQKIFGMSVVDKPDADWQRKNRFIDHLLARFAEQFADYSDFCGSDDSDKEVLLSKLAMLNAYDKISSAKGSGFNAVTAYSNENRSGLEQILRLKLGIAETGAEKLYVLEHALLRPMDGDNLQQGPLLKNALSQDTYSLQLSVVFLATADRSDDFKRFVERTVREEAPAHLIVSVCWMALNQVTDFDAAYRDWQQQHFAYRMLSNQRILNGPTEQSAAIPLRAARDRLIDYLGIGETYPLRDLAISETSKVAYNIKARIVISNSQQGVSYRLCDDQQHALTPDIALEGNGGDLELISPPIVTNRKFTIQATKISNKLSTVLLKTIIVNVGLDLGLAATLQNDAGVVDYDAKIAVAVDETQEGVDYQLVTIDGTKENVLSLPVRGDSKTIVLKTTAGVTEDIDIRIRATKKFHVSEQKDTETDLLSTVLPVKVKANPALGVSALIPIVDFSGAAGIKIQGSQASTRYQVLMRSIADHEIIYDVKPGAVISIAVDGQQAVLLAPPALTGDFKTATDAVQGNGGDLVLSVTNLTEDSFILLQAIKTHQVNNGEPVSSTVQLSQLTAVLVRPNANPDLHLKAQIANSLLLAPIQVNGGQAGVYYEFTTVSDKKVQGLPVYFHQRDSIDNSQNKGVGQLKVGIDLVIPPNLLPERLKTNPNPASLPPEPPELSAGVILKSDAELSIRAIKAQTGVEVVFKRTVSELLT